MKYNIYIWPRESAQLVFKELAMSFREVLSAEKCSITDEFIEGDDTVNIIFGANDHLFVPKEIPANSIIVNLEQVGDGQYWNKDSYIDLLKSHQVWDYSQLNIDYLKSVGVKNIKKIEIGYTKSLETCAPFVNDTQFIDVLFYGAMNTRRKQIMVKLKSIGIRATWSANLFGVERDLLIANSKIVLNIHYHKSKILEVVRLSHLLANKKCVISEEGSEEDVNNIWKQGVVMCKYEEIVSNVLIYLFDDNKREKQEENAYTFIRDYPLILNKNIENEC